MTEPGYSCPYCCSTVSVHAVVCAHCGRDLVLFRPLALSLERLAKDVSDLKERVQHLQGARLAPAQAPVSGFMEVQEEATAPEPAAWGAALAQLGLSVATTAAAHWILLFVYDTRPVVLRVVTMALPAVIAYALASRLPISLGLHAVLSLMVGVLSVAAMLGITAGIDGVSWLPQDSRELREALEYGVAIGLSAWTAQAVHRLQRERRRRARLAELTALLGKDGVVKLEDLARTLKRALEAVAPVCSGAMALYSGFKAFAAA